METTANSDDLIRERFSLPDKLADQIGKLAFVAN